MNLKFFEDFAKYVEFKQECWYVKDQLHKYTHRKASLQNLERKKKQWKERLMGKYGDKEEIV